jgi:hypothetical protein
MLRKFGLAVFAATLFIGVSRAGDVELLRRLQSDNKAAASSLRDEAERLLGGGSPNAADIEPLRKLLVQLEKDVLLPNQERAKLTRKVEDRLRECTAKVEPTDGDSRTSKTSVKQTGVIVNMGPIVATAPGGAALIVGPSRVAVPDGGTSVLGGFSYLAEERSEYGPPGLGKIPYLSRGFRNVGWSRAIGSTNISVTARIIIMEEEEAKFLGR